MLQHLEQRQISVHQIKKVKQEIMKKSETRAMESEVKHRSRTVKQETMKKSERRDSAE